MHFTRPIPVVTGALMAWGVAAPAVPAPAPAKPAGIFTAPEVRVQGYRVVVESVHQAQNWTADFPSGLSPDGKAPVGKESGRQLVYVRLAIFPPKPQMVPNIEGLGSKIVAQAAPNQTITFRSYQPDEVNPLLAGAWRTQIMAQELDLDLARLNRLQGELLVYPRAKVVTLDFPLNGKLPQVQEAEGFRATLKSSSFAKNSLTARIETEWDPGMSVTRPNPDSPSGITAISRSGIPLQPSGGGTSNSERGKKQGRQYSLTFMDVKEPPAKVRVQVLVRSGTVQQIPFQFPEIPLPNGIDLASHLKENDEAAEPLREGHPLYANPGGAVRFAVGPPPTPREGRLLVGFSRQETGGFGPWRWIEAAVDQKHQASVGKLKPGRYRVARAWAPLTSEPDGAGPVPASRVQTGRIVEIEVTAGKEVDLPPVEGKPQ